MFYSKEAIQVGKFVLLKGQSNYGSLRLHIDQLLDAFNKLGYDAVVIDLLDSDFIDQLTRIIKQPIDFFIAFNGMGIDLKIGNESLYDVLNVPFIAAMVDNPHFHLPRLSAKMKQLYITVLDEGHLSFLKNYFSENHFQAAMLWPPGGNRNLAQPIVRNTEEQFKKRSLPILFTGSFRGVPQRAWKNYPPSVAKIMDDTAEVILQQDTMNFEEGLSTVLRFKGIELSKEQQKKFHQLMPHVNSFVHATRRYSFLNKLAEAELPVNLYGQGWGSMKEKWKSFLIQEEGSFTETLDLLRDAKLVLNTNTHFVNGVHERVFAAMINGAAVLTDVSTYYENHFQDGIHLLTYQWTDLNQAPKTIESYLNDESALYNIAKQGQRSTLKEHSWRARAGQIVNFVEMNRILHNMEGVSIES